MNIENLKIEMLSSEETNYNANQDCQCGCGKLTLKTQPNNISYYYTVNDRAISPDCLGTWLEKIGNYIADNPHPYWLHASFRITPGPG